MGNQHFLVFAHLTLCMGVSTCVRAPIPAKRFDVVVIGGGIVGVAIARTTALAGKSTLLLEQHDFASGATCRGPRIVGDVFSDLERGDFAIARETLRERDRLLVERPHLVRPMTGIIALGAESRRSKLEVRFGLWLRRRLGNASQWRPNDAEIDLAKQALGPQRAASVFAFDDATCDFPERLVAEWLREAVAAGAIARNYCRALEVVVKDGTAVGVRTRDLCTDMEQEINAEWVVNATGPFAEQFCSDSHIETPRTIAPLRAIHLALQRFPAAPEATIHFEGVDGNEVMLSPWNGQLLLSAVRPNSNALPFAGPSEAEQDYLRLSLNSILPGVEIRVNTAFAAPVAAFGEGALESPGERNRSLVLNHPGTGKFLTVISGSLTASAFAVAECGRQLGLRTRPDSECVYLPGRGNGIEATLQHWAHAVASSSRIPERVARSIAAWHGRGALCIARLAAGNAELRTTLCPHTDHIVAEAIDAVRYEGALTLADILMRRLPVALSSCWSEECTRTAAQRIGKWMNWSAAQNDLQVECVEAERAAFLVKPGPLRDLSDQLAA
ncbi:glycerol-3-phosphate dehydrogenase/oxidase [Candidatus Korobacter versatilis]|uniref:glycerol-3-phosphate dehydrogenase/oxidase n=1 Tax=Candidatus Korobacter versatilis TaxID=658062 RepID=UPI000300D33E|nr:FAD-dependent oxidoreductase [Candidatus Koribacter versatilis]